MKLETKSLDFTKLAGLVPAIIQDALTAKVLMLGFMNEEAVKLSLETNFVHFYSRTKQRIWKKGETSGNTLLIKEIACDCDNDTLLIKVMSSGPTCHTGTNSCFGDNFQQGFLATLEAIINDRKQNPDSKSYTSSLFNEGIKRIAQKVGEEGVETALAALVEDDDKLVGEAADLVFHLMVLLRERGVTMVQVLERLEQRHKR